jgi:hypothetical protein
VIAHAANIRRIIGMELSRRLLVPMNCNKRAGGCRSIAPISDVHRLDATDAHKIVARGVDKEDKAA